jgi:hypothetical protein
MLNSPVVDRDARPALADRWYDESWPDVDVVCRQAEHTAETKVSYPHLCPPYRPQTWLAGYAPSQSGQFHDRQGVRGMHSSHSEPRICGEGGQLVNATFPATEVGEHP